MRHGAILSPCVNNAGWPLQGRALNPRPTRYSDGGATGVRSSHGSAA